MVFAGLAELCFQQLPGHANFTKILLVNMVPVRFSNGNKGKLIAAPLGAALTGGSRAPSGPPGLVGIANDSFSIESNPRK